MSNFFKKYWILIIILVVGFSLRVVDLQKNSLYGDELTMVYDAYSILRTGYDQTGKFLPLTFTLGDHRPAGYVYFSIPFVGLFGPNELSARILSVISGVLIIFLMFVLGKKLFSENVGLIAAFFTSISPWDLSLSRGGFETHFALFWTLLAIILFLYSSKKPLFLVLAALSFILATNTYSTYKLTVPLLFIILLIFTKQYKLYLDRYFRKYVFFAFLVLLLGAIIFLYQALVVGSEGRFLNINLFASQDVRSQVISKVNYERGLLKDVPYNELFHNQFIEYGLILIDNYYRNFSLSFLFIHGDRNPRQNMSTLGEFYFIDVLLVFLGIHFGFNKYKKIMPFLIAWLLIAPIPSAILADPHSLRSSLMLPPLVLLISLGFYSLLNLRYFKKPILFIFCLVLFLNFIVFAEKFYLLAPNLYGNFWSYSAKQASLYITDNKQNYDYILVSDRINDIQFAYLVYARIDSSLVQLQNRSKSNLGKYQVKKFDNVYIGYFPDGEENKLIDSLPGSVLYVGTPNEIKYLEKYETIEGLDGFTSFVIRKKANENI